MNIRSLKYYHFSINYTKMITSLESYILCVIFFILLIICAIIINTIYHIPIDILGAIIGISFMIILDLAENKNLH